MALKRPRIVMKKITDSARGEACTLNFQGCQGRHPSVVFCHSPYNFHGKGTGQKAHDIFGCYGCKSCHDLLDGRKRPPKDVPKDTWARFKMDRFMLAMSETWIRLIEKEVLK